MSIYINKYKTMQKLLFTSYPDIAFSDVGVAKLDKLLGTWNALNYDDIIDFLIYHSFISYPSLNADGILKEYFELNFDKALSTLSKLQGKRLYDGLDIFYKKSKVKTSKFILNNIEIFKDKTLIDKVISKIQVEKLSKNKMEILLNHQESHVREIASLLR